MRMKGQASVANNSPSSRGDDGAKNANGARCQFVAVLGHSTVFTLHRCTGKNNTHHCLIVLALFVIHFLACTESQFHSTLGPKVATNGGALYNRECILSFAK